MIDLEKKQQIARENGSKSHGPVSLEGKQRSSLNGITHGLASKCVVLANENQEEYDKLSTAYRAEWKPATVTELHLVTEMANATWRLRRIWSMETALFDSEMFCNKKAFDAAWSNPHPAMRVIDAVTSVLDANPTTLETLHRYETRYDRLHKSSMEQLLKLRRKRKSPEIECTLTDDSEPQPQLKVGPLELVERQAAPPAANWLGRIMVLLMTLIAASNKLKLRKSRSQPRKAAPGTSEPTSPLETAVYNFYLPEFFFWEAPFIVESARSKVKDDAPPTDTPLAA